VTVIGLSTETTILQVKFELNLNI